MLPFSSVLRTPRSEWDQRLVADCMLRREEVPVLSSDQPALNALRELDAGHLHRGLVLDDGRLAGLISITDIARALSRR